MEWMLQVVDEIDDAIGALRLCCVGGIANLGLVVAGCFGIGAISAALLTGAEVPLLCAAIVVLSLAAVLKVNGAQLLTSR